MSAPRRAVVLGAAGFIGSHLVARLISQGREVVAVSRPGGSAGTHAAAARIVIADATSADQLRPVIAAGDVIYVLAGRSGAAASVVDPMGDLIANAGTILAVLQVVAALEPRPRIVFTGSRLQYGRVATLPVEEDHPLDAITPYGLHKTFCEVQLAYAYRTAGVPYAVARLTNPYGGRSVTAHKTYNVLDQIVRRAVHGEPITVYGDGSQLRDYVHIDDVLDALILLGDIDETITVNIGAGIGIPFRLAVERIAERTGAAVVSVPWPPAAFAVETGDFVASIERARSIGYEPRVSFESGIARSVERMHAAIQREER